ncbi:hypothetical protein TELCIR_02923 [Teladorsagia circumcincta]|uniref:Alpha-carbonic anhydrase domain-containing protein n=1 Tax=Teladorsagia circumcincta TaxID=45464 RepID=A0A2G9UXR0_TELCI|nr:hypothetical protein TELCIR_02923 [Teladorsagia circumcincta]
MVPFSLAKQLGYPHHYVAPCCSVPVGGFIALEYLPVWGKRNIRWMMESQTATVEMRSTNGEEVPSSIPMALLLILILRYVSIVTPSSNDYPWSYDYDTYQGPQNWGLLFKPWMMCHNGKMQSPIDIPPDRLLFDPNMKPIHIDRISVMSEMLNTGQMPRIRIGNSARRPSANLTGGPLHGYRYRIQRIDIHIGRGAVNGSEHTIDGRRFPMEVNIMIIIVDIVK